MPLVFQYNKRDLPQVLEVEALDRALNARRVEVVPAVAVRGEGVLETFGAILARTVQDLASRYAILDVKEGAPARQWAEQALLELFGRTRLSFDPQGLARHAADAAGRAGPGARRVGADAPVRRRRPPPATPSSGWRRRPRRPRRPPRRGPRREGERARRDLRRGLGPARAPRSPSCARSATSRASASRTCARPWRRAGPARRHAARGGARARARAHGPHRGRRARGASGSRSAGQPPRAASLLGLEPDPVLGLSRGPAPRLGDAPARREAGLRLRRGEPRPRRRRSTGRAALRGPPRRSLPHPGGLQGLGVFYYGPDTARPGPEAPRAPRRDPARPLRRRSSSSPRSAP